MTAYDRTRPLKHSLEHAQLRACSEPPTAHGRFILQHPTRTQAQGAHQHRPPPELTTCAHQETTEIAIVPSYDMTACGGNGRLKAQKKLLRRKYLAHLRRPERFEQVHAGDDLEDDVEGYHRLHLHPLAFLLVSAVPSREKLTAQSFQRTLLKRVSNERAGGGGRGTILRHCCPPKGNESTIRPGEAPTAAYFHLIDKRHPPRFETLISLGALVQARVYDVARELQPRRQIKQHSSGQAQGREKVIQKRPWAPALWHRTQVHRRPHLEKEP